MADEAPLRLLAHDADDLSVISAALQDAVMLVRDITFERRGRRLTLVVNRYRWELKERRRVRSALQFSGVLSVQARKVRRDAPDAVLALLAIDFEPGEAPGGLLSVRLAGGGDIRVQLECLDALLVDVSPSWSTPRTPEHDA